MSALERKRIRVDWQELVDAFEDGCADHRYYLDRETGAVHFFSEYLDNEEEEADERAITSEERYVRIPNARHTLSETEMARFVASLADENERRALSSALRTEAGPRRFREAVETLPWAWTKWKQFSRENLKTEIEEWLAEVNVEPL